MVHKVTWYVLYTHRYTITKGTLPKGTLYKQRYCSLYYTVRHWITSSSPKTLFCIFAFCFCFLYFCFLLLLFVLFAFCFWFLYFCFQTAPLLHLLHSQIQHCLTTSWRTPDKWSLAMSWTLYRMYSCFIVCWAYGGNLCHCMLCIYGGFTTLQNSALLKNLSSLIFSHHLEALGNFL